jgi:hypothetical protein
MALTGTLHLSGLWPPFAEAVRYLRQWSDYYGLEAQIVSGYRTAEEQRRLYAIGRTYDEVRAHVSKHGTGGTVTDAAPGESAHNYGLAIDVEGRDQYAVVELARRIGFGTVSWDPAHVEWPGWRHLLR